MKEEQIPRKLERKKERKKEMKKDIDNDNSNTTKNNNNNNNGNNNDNDNNNNDDNDDAWILSPHGSPPPACVSLEVNENFSTDKWFSHTFSLPTTNPASLIF